MYFRRLGGLVGVGLGFSGKSWRILDESAAKCGVGRGGGETDHHATKVTIRRNCS